MSEENMQTNKNLIPYAIVIAGVIVAGAVIFTGLYLKGGGFVSALEKAAEPAAVAQPEESAETPQYDTATLDKFAKCLAAKGMKFYGASWCSWCNKEKGLFGEAKDSLPYIECIDAKDQQTLIPACQTAGIQSFPTWQLPNGTKEPGFKTLEQLAQVSGCVIGE